MWRILKELVDEFEDAHRCSRESADARLEGRNSTFTFHDCFGLPFICFDADIKNFVALIFGCGHADAALVRNRCQDGFATS